MFEHFNYGYLYYALEFQRTLVSPVNIAAKAGKHLHSSPLNPIAYTDLGRRMAASMELLERMTRNYSVKPEWHIHETEVDGQVVDVEPKVFHQKTFCHLLHFAKKCEKKQPKMLMVAPLSGHYATLLRGTVEGLLPHFDVYITDWQNARDVPLSKGTFSLDDYIDYLIDFMHRLKEPVHVMGVCQPSVPVFAATALMSAKKDPLVPKTMTLIGGPIDTRKNPTEVNRHAETKSLKWFEQNVIMRVPVNYSGFMRSVYPGFIQLTGFMTMNLERHLNAHVGLFNHLVEGDGEGAEAHREFYNEYLTVMDLPAEFYLQTIETVFQKHLLPRGEMVSRGRKVDANAITQTGVLAIEGERDDISGRGQTKAALDLCKNLASDKKHYHLQKNVGHYGSFNGRRFREEVVPVICEFAKKNQ